MLGEPQNATVNRINYSHQMEQRVTKTASSLEGSRLGYWNKLLISVNRRGTMNKQPNQEPKQSALSITTIDGF